MFSQNYSALENQPLAMPLETIRQRLLAGSSAVAEASSSAAAEEGISQQSVSDENPEIRSSKIDYLISCIMILNHQYTESVGSREATTDRSKTSIILPKIIVFRYS